MSNLTALSFMQAAEAPTGNSATVADLPATVLHLLAAPCTQEPIRQEFMREADAVVDVILDRITDALADGDRVELRDFGTFLRPRP
ncbi:HU family DNA-binding protein [Methylobacterium sp. J-026]|uniref:HU family DNA-binding protein n=1 Tax=Methylobacterium sp. J-026 TaxID=2836624 RepID=UPI001FBAB14D|nr:HU family DNA-binding protein [Methylobacterium sp. J-026]MCJ2135603.1 HU family DNA-binding protein [Methylobacterium sp. J-026]